MNRGYIRPPYPVYRIIAGVVGIGLVIGSFGVSLRRLGPLQHMYWGDYVMTTVPEIRLPSLGSLGGFAQVEKATTQKWLLLTCGELRVTVKNENLLSPKEMKLTEVEMSREQMHQWLRENIYGGRPAFGFFLFGVFVALLLTSGLQGIGWRLDLRRHMRFRESERHLRGTEFVTPRQFNAHVGGDGVAFWHDQSILARTLQASAGDRQGQVGK